MLSTPRKRRTAVYFVALTVLFSIPFLTSYKPKTQLEIIREAGEIRVLTRNTPTTYFINHGKPSGYEYELTQAFADFIGVRLKLISVDNLGDLVEGLRMRNGHIAASMLAVTPKRRAEFDFSPSYMTSQSILVYRVIQGKKRPKSLQDTFDRSLTVMKNSSHAELLQHYSEGLPELTWTEADLGSDIELLEQVHDKQLDFTVIDSVNFASQKSYYPGLKKAFDLTEPQPIAWMMSRYHDDSIQQAMDRFFKRPNTQKLISELHEKYFNRKNTLNFFDTVTFKKDLSEKFSLYEQTFREAGELTGLNWKLLAAVSYQESHWNPKAVSPTGVRGLMMLTRATAKEMGVKNREDPEQSIIGGAKYLKKVKGKIPKRIQEPDRTWLALASYNIGYGHLEDARVLTAKAGKNPDKWDDVKRYLPLLSKREYFSKTRYGYARGGEPVAYVHNIRKYQELFEWEQQVAQMKEAEVIQKEADKAEAKEPEAALEHIPAAL